MSDRATAAVFVLALAFVAVALVLALSGLERRIRRLEREMTSVLVWAALRGFDEQGKASTPDLDPKPLGGPDSGV